MAIPPPPRTQLTTFTTANEAFSYPLPTVRAYHKQLLTALDEKNARLRTLVGGSYRQLLGTAEMIVDMRRDIEVVEGKLAKVAEGCGKGILGKRVAGLAKLGMGTTGGGLGLEEVVDLGWVARYKVLDGCVFVVGRILRGKLGVNGVGAAGQGQSKSNKGTSLVVAAKVLVLSRLLVKSLGDESSRRGSVVLENGIEGGEEVEEAKRRLGALRRRLLTAIERMLTNIDEDRDELTHALCAYSLATSSGSKDVLRHFLHVRGEAIALAFEEDEAPPPKKIMREENMVRALALFTRTLLDAQALAPRQLCDALLSLKGEPLLKDSTIRSLEGLRLDISDRWFGDEIMFFTPYIRHDELDGPSAIDMLKSWAKRASEVLLGGFEITLGHTIEFKTIVELRTKIFEAWILEGGKVKVFDSSVMLYGLQKVVNGRLISLLEARISKLHLVGVEIEAVLDTWASASTKTQMGLWTNELLETELTDGAEDFKQAIISGVYGRNNSVSRVVKGYERWLYLINELVASINQLRHQRWNNDIDSLEDDETLESRNALLNEGDPRMLQDWMDKCLEQAYKALHQKIATLLAIHKESEHAGGIATFILRVLRDISAAMPNHPDLKSFGLPIIPSLHSTLAASVSSEPVASFTKSIIGQKRVVGRALWEGDPGLPTHPSPSAFKFLHRLTSSMATAGGDLWSPAAVNALKRHLHNKLGQEWSRALEVHLTEEVAQANGHKSDGTEQAPSGAETSEDVQVVGGAKPAESDQSLRRDVLIQSLFDIYFLQHSLPLPGADATSDRLLGLKKDLISLVDLADTSVQRLYRAAQEYWKRTGLLFGLLV